jgi:L,D-peptidoglycan transpeptidase YkuD (ErfK/YbiS/YcfS/YnhG family)
LCWEKENDDIDFNYKKRLVFNFGDEEQKVKDKLYERDIVLEFEKKVVYEN